MTKMLKVTHEGVLKLNNTDLDVAVLENGTRVVNQASVFKAFDRPSRGNSRVINIPVFMDAKNLQPFITSELQAVINKIDYIDLSGNQKSGFDAIIIPLVADLYLRARESGAINRLAQLETAQKAEILVRSLAKLGIIALIDETTGYQYDRERLELQKTLNAYIAEETLKWQLTFKLDFYKELFRLWEIPFSAKNIAKKPQFIGKLTLKLIYEQLPKGVVERLKEITPKGENGYKYRLHQNLTPEIGREHLKEQIHKVTTLMEISKSKDGFWRLFDERYGSGQISLDLDEM
ncbi:MAG: P63C domain-containing protein [Turicibacter sp.]|nr:P63C domain-containing protein [Turicibacter sp.]